MQFDILDQFSNYAELTLILNGLFQLQHSEYARPFNRNSFGLWVL